MQAGSLRYIFVLWAYRYRTPQLLREARLESGVAVCIACGYDLRRLPARRCPECGRPFDGRVREIPYADLPRPVA